MQCSIVITYKLLSPNIVYMFCNKYISKPTSALHEAVAKCSLENLKVLLDQGSEDINVVSFHKQTLLHSAIEKNFEQGVVLLLERGANVNLPDSSLSTPLHRCCWTKNENIFKCLLEKGSDIHFKDKRKKTALHLAITFGFITGVNMLIERGADLDVRDREGNTPLIMAIITRNEPLIETLINRGARLDVRNNRGYTPLHMAARWMDIFAVRLLLDKGAEVNCQDDSGCTPLHLVHSDRAIVRLLLQRGAKVDIQDRTGCTPVQVVLQGMTYCNNNSVVEELLDWGSSMHIRDINGQTPLATANKQMVSVDGIKRHIIKLQFANLPMQFNYYIDLSELKIFQKACLAEVAKLKVNRFGWNSLFDVFSKYPDPTFVLNDSLEQAIKSPCVEREFPIYCSLLRSMFEQSQKRIVLLDKAQNTVNVPMPTEIIRKILSYLDNRDLENVIKAVKQYKRRLLRVKST